MSMPLARRMMIELRTWLAYQSTPMVNKTKSVLHLKVNITVKLGLKVFQSVFWSISNKAIWDRSISMKEESRKE